MNHTGFNAYKRTAGSSVLSKDKILLKLYQGMLKFASLAKRGIEINSPKIRGENISKILAIITELNCALDNESGGKIAEGLSNLYQYMIERLTTANIENDISALEEVKDLLTELNDGFLEALKPQNNKAPVSSLAGATTMDSHEKVGVRFAV